MSTGVPALFQVLDDSAQLKVLLPHMTPEYFVHVDTLCLAGFCPNIRELVLLFEELLFLGEKGPKTLECVGGLFV